MQAHKRPSMNAGAFLCPSVRVMAAVRGRPSGLPGSCISGFSARAQLPPTRLRTKVAALITDMGVSIMYARNLCGHSLRSTRLLAVVGGVR